MTEVSPDIHCVDFWPGGIPPEKLTAYKRMIDAGQIVRNTAVVNRSTGAVLVEYLSTVPHDWIRQEMGRMSRQGTQEAMA